jgi:hypothetical protein
MGNLSRAELTSLLESSILEEEKENPSSLVVVGMDPITAGTLVSRGSDGRFRKAGNNDVVFGVVESVDDNGIVTVNLSDRYRTTVTVYEGAFNDYNE